MEFTDVVLITILVWFSNFVRKMYCNERHPCSARGLKCTPLLDIASSDGLKLIHTHWIGICRRFWDYSKICTIPIPHILGLKCFVVKRSGTAFELGNNDAKGKSASMGTALFGVQFDTDFNPYWRCSRPRCRPHSFDLRIVEFKCSKYDIILLPIQ